MPREAPEQLCLLLLTLLDQACLSACGSAIMLCWTSLRVTYLFLNDRPIINLDFSSWNQVSTTSFAETQMSHVEKLQRGSFPLSPLASVDKGRSSYLHDKITWSICWLARNSRGKKLIMKSRLFHEVFPDYPSLKTFLSLNSYHSALFPNR